MAAKVISYINTWRKGLEACLAAMLFTLPLSRALPNLLLIPLLILLIAHHKAIRFRKPFVLISFSGAIVWLIGSGIAGHAPSDDLSGYWRYLSVIACLIAVMQIKRIRLLEIGFLFGLGIALLGSFINILSYALNSGEFLLANGAIVNQILWVERPYFGFMLAIGLFILLKNYEHHKGLWRLVSAFLIYGFTIYISARMAILLQTGIGFFFLIKTRHIKYSFKIWTGLIAILIVVGSLLSNDNFTKRMKLNQSSFEESIAKFMDYEPRFVIWPCAAQIATQHANWLTGLQSEKSVNQALTACYAHNIINNDSKRDYFAQQQFNTHNQFLGFLLYGGVVPFILLLGIFIFILSASSSSLETKLVFSLFLMFFLVENVLERQLGCFLFGIFAAIYQDTTWAKSKSYIF